MAPGYPLEALGYQTILGPMFLLRSFILKPRQTARTNPVVTSPEMAYWIWEILYLRLARNKYILVNHLQSCDIYHAEKKPTLFDNNATIVNRP